MSDEELIDYTDPDIIARQNIAPNAGCNIDGKFYDVRNLVHLASSQADRIEALTAKLAKTAKVALAYEDWVTDAYDLLEERREEFDPESPSDKAIMDLMDKAEAGIARATLAEIKGE